MSQTPVSYLLVIGEREALAWILSKRRMAFPATRRWEIDSLSVGDRLFLMTTRGCFHSPTRDVSRVIGIGCVMSAVTPLDTPLQIAGREFNRVCDLSISALAPYREGVELRPLVAKLDVFAGAVAWGMRLRKPLVSMCAADAELLDSKLATVCLDPQSSQQEYLDRILPATSETRVR